MIGKWFGSHGSGVRFQSYYLSYHNKDKLEQTAVAEMREGVIFDFDIIQTVLED